MYQNNISRDYIQRKIIVNIVNSFAARFHYYDFRILIIIYIERVRE